MKTETLRRYSAAEVALLGVFALGLLLSLVLVKVRSKIELDAPVELAVGGLAAPLPKGPQWETAGGWHYEGDNAFVLLGRMGNRGQVIMNVRWRYALCDDPIPSAARLKQLADSANGQLLPLGEAPGPLAMQYGRIYAPTDSGEEFLMGVARLDFGRSLELLITYRSDPTFAENAFLAMAGGVVYQRLALIEAGAEQVQRFYADRLGTLSDPNGPHESAFLIQDAAKQPLGYVVSRLSVSDSDLHIATRQLELSGLYAESDLWLTAADPAFKWKTQTWLAQLGRPRVAELVADAAGRLSVQQNTEHERVLQRTAMMLPEPLLSAFVAGLNGTDGCEMIVDVLTGGGLVVPTRLTKIDPGQSAIRSEQAVRVVRAEYLYTDGEYDDLVFDAAGRLLGIFEQKAKRPGRLWAVTSEEQLQKIFGERFKPRGIEAAWLTPGFKMEY